MKTRVIVIAFFCSLVSPVYAQNNSVEQFLHDQSLQDTIIATIVHNHSLMSKLINRVSDDPQLHEMVIQHLTRLLKEKGTTRGEHDHASHATMSHYTGDEAREIKALSKTETDGLLNGEGVGLAMAAELNHYPGPRHVLDLGDQLQLTEAQKKSIQGAFDRMHARAVGLGKRLVEKERALDKAFASATITQKSLRQLTQEVEALRGQLRNVHLAAHIEARSVLTQKQIESYDSLRGYTAGM
jgi:Spy/CpxP family protein refolding chaperone